MDSYSRQIFSSLNPYHTMLIGRHIGLQITSGTSVMLMGDLGSGKTTFVKGVADGLGVPNTEYVNSPTYNLIHQYSGRFTLYHVDLYRLNDFSELEDIGLMEIFGSKGVVLVEWPEKINPKDLPNKRLDINFNIGSSFARCISLICHGSISILPFRCKDDILF